MKKLPIVAIVGRANVGKSSLFNAILKRREVIVAREAGTTRDSITAKAEWRDKNFWIVDTAGIKDPEDDFEFTIQEQIKQASDSADLILVVIEAPAVISDEDRRVAKDALKSKKPVMLVVNKIDQVKKYDINDYKKLGIKDIVVTAVPQRRGMEELLDKLYEQIPAVQQADGNDVLRIALLGRPNVGKSQLFNTLAKKQQAIVADRAGTTRDINRATIRYQSREIQLLDTAGIRRSGKIEVGIEKFSVIRSLSAIEESDVCLLLMEANELNTTLDQKIAGFIKESGKGLVLVISKWDSLEGKTPYTRDQLALTIKHTFDFVPWAPLILTSAITGQNVTKLYDLALDIEKERNKLIPTSKLNKWLQKVTDMHPPAGLKNRSPKLNYIVQEDDNPTNFKVYTSNGKFLHWSYKRYMDRKIREEFGFSGTPVKFWFFDKNIDRKK